MLGNLWHLLNPALSIAIYYVIFGLLLDTTRGVDNFILFITIGIFVFQYTQRATTQGATSITQNLGLLKAIRFPTGPPSRHLDADRDAVVAARRT